ncbi:cytochrome c oxidase assembly protein [Gordonia sp. PDNC005]|uniref:cytochrome c oxidase assembly protein n=1 Tax=unclassified Gordonia (in: high G+C Gram-positive bacteria) TaxID=2657482 RepID=UPI0019633E27|nr:cytochrome c oxidase assembly protein [Gordonia sp. PDNC005]QRY61317.1 cytochrome c oxidase assembly protein [Gordonia sp. PDNC005]
MNAHGQHRVTDPFGGVPDGASPVLALTVLVSLAAILAYGVIASQAGGVRWPVRRFWFFAVGTIGVAWSTLAVAYGPAVMVGHVVGMMVAPAFLVLARPLRLILRSCSPDDRRRARRVVLMLRRLHGHRSVGWAVVEYVLSMALMLLTPLMAVLGGSVAAHVAVALYMAVCGVGFYSAVLGIGSGGSRASEAVRRMSARRAGAGMVAVGVTIAAGLGWGGASTADGVVLMSVGGAAGLFGVAAVRWHDESHDCNPRRQGSRRRLRAPHLVRGA